MIILQVGSLNLNASSYTVVQLHNKFSNKLIANGKWQSEQLPLVQFVVSKYLYFEYEWESTVTDNGF